MNFVKGETRKLDCYFAAPVRVVYWYKNNKLITNGTDGLYQSYDQLTDVTFRSTLHFPTVRMKHEASYTCKAGASQTTTRCPNGQTIDINVHCKYCFCLTFKYAVLIEVCRIKEINNK